jgi:steroid delta-isomerase-like uncharacterized protein
MAATPFEVARRWFEEVWNQRRAETIDELLPAGGVGHLATGDIIGPAEFRKFHAVLLAALPDLSLHVNRIIADEDEAVVHWRIDGTHRGELFEVAATGKPLSFSGMTRMIVKNGVIKEGWDSWDAGALREQLRSTASK